MKSSPLSPRPLAFILMAAGLVAGGATPALAAEYHLVDLGSLGGNHTLTYATGLNASGQVVGYGYRFDLWNSGTSGASDPGRASSWAVKHTVAIMRGPDSIPNSAGHQLSSRPINAGPSIRVAVDRMRT